MLPSNEHIGFKIPAKINTHMLTHRGLKLVLYGSLEQNYLSLFAMRYPVEGQGISKANFLLAQKNWI